jgi:hypothetical protein
MHRLFPGQTIFISLLFLPFLSLQRFKSVFILEMAEIIFRQGVNYYMALVQRFKTSCKNIGLTEKYFHSTEEYVDSTEVCVGSIEVK